MAQVSQLHCKEPMALDPTRLFGLYAELGQDAAERLIAAAVEDLAYHLGAIEEAALSGQRMKLRRSATEVIMLSEQVGLTSMAHVARDLSDCLSRNDAAAQAAVMARLARIAERSLTEVWDLGDLSG